MVLVVGILLWLGFGLASWCVYQGAYKHRCYAWLPPDIVFSATLGLFAAPICFLATAMTYGLRHWSLFPITKEERWEVWKNRGWGDSPEDRKEFEERGRGEML